MAEKKEEDGVLLYYKYASVPDLEGLVNFYDSNCKSLELLGRVRIAPDGVNVTVGGKLSALEKHIVEVKSNELFEGTDFKLASCSCPSNDKIAKECGFTSLSIRVVKEFDILGSFNHLIGSPLVDYDLHDSSTSIGNHYELVTFSSHPQLKSPPISNAGRHLTAVEFNSVLQSAGNILENDDLTRHKKLILLDARNVYETRIGKFETPNVETLDPEIRQYSDLPSWIDNHSEQLQGNCILMYCTGGIRCEMASAYIRSKGAGFENVFQLYGGIQRYLEHFPDGGFFKGKNFVFDHRISVKSSNEDIVGSCLLCGSTFDDYSSRCRCTYCRMLVLVCDNCQTVDAKYVCELCHKHGKEGGPIPLNEGSRYQTESTIADGSGAVEFESATLVNKPPRKLRILCLHGFRQNALNFKGRTASLAKKLKNLVDFVFIDAPHQLPFIYQPHPTKTRHGSVGSQLHQTLPPLENCKKKYAWLVAPEFDSTRKTNWEMADEPFDPLQYQKQTDGFDVSLAFLKSIFSQAGPFDGVLGFSQGAAMAASLCAERGRLDGDINFRFAILCSGFAINAENLERGSIDCPSLHIFGNWQGKDRQISCHTSMELANLFKQGCSVVIEHESGHIIPTHPPYIDRIKDFLQCFL